MSLNRPPQFDENERQTLHKIMASRRDMRHFIKGASVPEKVMTRLFEAAHLAPSVGLMQPWRFIRILDPGNRQKIAQMVEDEICKTADTMGERKSEFCRLKLEGVRQCAQLIAVILAPDDGTLLGRRTMPRDMALCSAACAIENMWLAARAENLGLGWVSLFEPDVLGALLHCPSDASPIALLCIGPVNNFYDKPMLVGEGWREAKPLGDVLFENNWPTEGE